MGHSGHGPLDLTMGQQWVGPDGAHVGFEWASPSPCESHGPTVAHGNPRRDLDGLAIWDGPLGCQFDGAYFDDLTTQTSCHYDNS